MITSSGGTERSIIPKHHERPTIWEPQQPRENCCGIYEFINNPRDTHKDPNQTTLAQLRDSNILTHKGTNMNKRKQTKTPTTMMGKASSEENFLSMTDPAEHNHRNDFKETSTTVAVVNKFQPWNHRWHQVRLHITPRDI